MDAKKKAAIMGAVYAHIKGEEEAVAAAQSAAVVSRSAAPMGLVNTWGLSGRQAIMQANTMMQMRMFK